jgi:hypothetical protein
MCNPTTAPVEAYAPDADRAGPEAPAQMPEWLVRLIARLILFLLEHLLAARPRRSHRLPSWWQDRPDLPAGSTQAEAASVRGQFGNAIAWMCRRNGIGPGHPDWPELSRAIVAFGGKLDGFRAGAPPCGLQWWENPAIVPGMIGVVSAPAAATAALLRLLAAADAPPPAPHAVPVDAVPADAVPADAVHARLPASCRLPTSWLSASWRQVFARAGPDPPAGLQAARAGCPGLLPGTAKPVMPDARGRSTAGPAVLIRAD